MSLKYKDSLSAFQIEKFTFMFNSLFDFGKSGYIEEADFDGIVESMREYTGWGKTSKKYRQIKDIHGVFFECLQDRVRAEKSLELVCNKLETNISCPKLTLVYASYIRPLIEYAGVVYDSMLTQGQSENIERLQATALKTIWGWNKSYVEVLQLAGIPRLDERRSTAVTNFAKKASQSERYKAWFPLNLALEHSLRRRDKYATDFAHHERLRRAPIYAMRRRLNELERFKTS